MFQIGEFSKIAQVSGRLLRYYDEIGLLTPDRIDAFTGYRYYTIEQLPRLNRILALKDLGFSLDQISNLLRDNLSPDEIRGMLTIKKAQIEQSLSEEINRLQQVERRLAQIENEGQMWGHDVILKQVPAMPFFSIRDQGALDPTFYELFLDIQRLLPAGKLPRSFGHLVVLMHAPIYEESATDLEVGFFMNRQAKRPLGLTAGHKLASGRDLSVRQLPAAATMASIVCKGWNEGANGYYALGNWIAANDFQITGPGREILFALRPLEEMANGILEIQFPVKRKKGS